MRRRVSDLCERRRITVRGLRGDSVVEAWCLGDWAAHRQIDEPDHWCLTLLPIGLSLPFVWASFPTLGRAVRAMRDIVRVRNDWHRVGQPDLTADLGGQIKAICARHGAVHGAVQAKWPADVNLLGLQSAQRLNGYTH